MGCNCKACNGIILEHEMGYSKPAKDPEREVTELPKKSVYDELLIFASHLPEHLIADYMKSLRKIDEIDSDIVAIQDKISREGDDKTAFKLGKISQRLF